MDDAKLGERLAARTLELVDTPSESRSEAELAERVAALLRAGGAEVAELGDSCLLAHPAGRAPGSCSPGTSTRCRRRTTCPAASTAARCTASARRT